MGRYSLMQKCSVPKKAWIFFVLIIVVIFLIIRFSDNDQEKRFSSSIPENLPASTYPDKLQLPPAPEVVQSTVERADTHNAPLLWKAANIEMPVALPDNIKEKAAVIMDKTLLLSLKAGDDIQFILPDGRQITGIVDKVILNPDGDKTIRARINTEFGDYPFTYTIGVNSGFGFIGLPDGRFTIETYGQESVVYKNPEQPRSLDPSKKDYVIPVRKP